MKPIVATFAPMKKHSAGDRDFARHIPLAIFGVVTAVFLARPLFGFGTLLPIDIIDGAAPWKAAASGGEPHNAFLSDTLDVHTHFANQAHDIRSGASSWWDRSIGGGIPSLKAGFSPLMWLYLVVPAWYAPGLVAAARTLLAAGLSYGFLRELRTNRVAATVGGVAYCISGYMVGWAGWPHSNVAAFLPGLFWAVERIVREPSLRRSVPVALVVAAMVVSNFPIVTIYGLLGAGFYALWRLGGGELAESNTITRLRHALRAALVATWGVVVGLLLASLHVLTFSEYFSWADTSVRQGIPADSSIGGRYLISVLFPRPFGSAHTGETFWAEGQNWVETQSYAGMGVLILAVVALITVPRRRGSTGDAATRAVATRALWTIAILVGWLTYAGGPLTTLVQSVPLLGQNPVGRARVVMNLALAILAGLGTQAWIESGSNTHVVDLRRGLRLGAGGIGLFALATSSFWWNWLLEAKGLGVLRETATASVIPLLAGGAILGLLWWSRRSSRQESTGARFGVAVLAVVATELLIFAIPVATVVDRGDADLITPAHQVVTDALEPGERLGGDARTFFANTAQVTGFDDMRGHLLPPDGWSNVYEALDLGHAGAPGTVTNPWFTDVNPLNPALDRLAVGVWATNPASPLSGSRSTPPTSDGLVSTQPGTAIAGIDLQVPIGGLRAVTVTVDGTPTGDLIAKLRIAGSQFTGTAILDVAKSSDGRVDIAFYGVEAVPGTPAMVTFIRSEDEPISLAGLGDRVVVSTVAADDGLELLRSSDVVLYGRPTATSAWLVGAAIENDEPVSGAAHSTPIDARAGVVPIGSDTGLPTQPVTITGTAVVTRAEGGTVHVDVATSEPALMVLSQPAYPGWKAYVDGEPVPILKTDGAFTGVVVSSGDHRVTLEYAPSHLRTATVLTALGVIFVLLSWALDRPRRKAPLNTADILLIS